MRPNRKAIAQHVQLAIRECWDNQSPYEPNEPEFQQLDAQVRAYQDVHVFLTGVEFTGADDEAEDVLREDDEDEDDTSETPRRD